ncbi:lasso peptide isopeptide bond-forming cyclase [Plectonema cf. radiosum LEGE 06105]|uniref:asparagine synthase (glutamine-hydrolyzing) n=1 Tax=Plectonema cf. radiosum LEGE 06105 TaxID=945769 RepID=A0A8J7F348_9CYAN|nr:lasso peptide isopeptide bond-forming cyclase [Plectonema radiosum]MBE9213093.1 lasso peptide isopeptide bond-forming cyclase [Plectonema cf. radiosum LEGE 06105]
MSGIMGLYYLDARPVEQQNLERMVDTLVHRGPDGADIWVDGSVGLGHRMLWTTPESIIEKLPLVNHTHDMVITCDCRIDNREELIAALELNNSSSEQITDSELILAAYEKWCGECPEHLLGDFVFAIWDQRKQRLFCARDHMGVKPFYYYYQPGKIFAFGSEIKALLCLPDVPQRLNEIKVGDYLESNFQDKVHTFYQDILRLPPACSLTLNEKGLQIYSYWSLDPERELCLKSDEDYAQALQEIFAEAVRCRLRSAFPIGSHLSGGLDSSAVTCMASKILQEENHTLHTFSNIFDRVAQCDERPFIEAVLAQGEMIPHYVHGDQLGPLSDLERIFKYHEQVVSAPTHFLIWGLNKAVANNEVRIILDGFDGDNTLSHGEGYLIELIRKQQWSTFAQEAKDLHKLVGVSPLKTLRCYGFPYLEELARTGKWITFVKEINQISQHFDISPKRLFLDGGFKPLLPESVKSLVRLLRGNNQSTDKSIINRDFVRRINLKKRIQALEGNRSTQPFTEREKHWRNITSGILTQGLETLDIYAAAFSQEARHPFMDKRLIEFCLSLPAEQKLNKGWSRLIMRRAMKNILPEQVRNRRTKANMSPCFRYGLLNHDKHLLEQVIQNHQKSIEGYVNTKVLSNSYEQLLSTSQMEYPPSSTGVSPWQVAMFALWLHHSELKQ